MQWMRSGPRFIIAFFNFSIEYVQEFCFHKKGFVTTMQKLLGLHCCVLLLLHFYRPLDQRQKEEQHNFNN